VARVLEVKLTLCALDHGANADRGIRAFCAVRAVPGSFADPEIIQTDGRRRGLSIAVAEREVPPRFIDVSDDPLLVEHRDRVGQGIDYRQAD
jgi:hypothetical protein